MSSEKALWFIVIGVLCIFAAASAANVWIVWTTEQQIQLLWERTVAVEASSTAKESSYELQ